MSDVLPIVAKVSAVVDSVVRPVLATMERERWRPEFRKIMLRAIAERFEREAAKCAEVAE